MTEHDFSFHLMKLEYGYLIVVGLILLAIVIYLATRRSKARVVSEQPPIPGDDLTLGYGGPTGRVRRGKGGDLHLPKGRATFPAMKRVPTKLFLSPSNLAQINMARKAAGRPMLNRTGFVTAAATAGTPPNNDWLTYFLLYECLFAHESHAATPTGPITVDPTQPYNGQGATYGGAGASGGWDAPADQSSGAGGLGAAVGAVSGAALGLGAAETYVPSRETYGSGYSAPDPTPTPSDASVAAQKAYDDYTPSEPSYTPTPDPTPSYSAPDPTPAYSAPDTGGGYSGGGGD